MTVLTHRRLPGLALLGLAALLAGCASGTGGSGKAELETVSDQTRLQRSADIHMQLAVGYYQQGRSAVALDEIKKVITAEPNNADAYGVRALIYMGMGQAELARDNFERALKLAPANPDVANNYGSFLCDAGKVPQALAYFDAALRNPAFDAPAKALNNAGSCAIKIKDYARAEDYLLRALKLTPDLPETNANLARVYYERRDYVRAGFFITRLGKTAKMESVTADVLWLAIKVQHKLGDAGAEEGWATQLRRHYSGSSEYAAYQRGAFDE